MAADKNNNEQYGIGSEEDDPRISTGEDEVNNDAEKVPSSDDEISKTSNNIADSKTKIVSQYSVTIHNEEAGPSIVIPDVQILQVRHIDDAGVGTSSGSETYGRTNLGYSYDCIEMLPVLTDLEERCKHRYSVATDTSDEDQDYSSVTVHRTCYCSCHTAEKDDLPSYERVMMSIQRSDLVLHDDINCTGVACSSKYPLNLHKHRLHLGHDGNKSNSNTPYGGSPCTTPGGTRKLVSQVDRIVNTSGKSSPILGRHSVGKEPPNYRSLIFSIIQDEPPKYEEVTGKKLADELVSLIFFLIVI